MTPPPRRPPDRRLLPRPARRRHLLLLAGLVLGLQLAFLRVYHGAGFDDSFYYAHLTSPLFDGDVDVANDAVLGRFTPGDERVVFSLADARGHVPNLFAPGAALLWSPAAGAVRLAGVAWRAAVRAFHADPRRAAWVGDRASAPYLWAVSLSTLTLYALGVLLTYDAAARLSGSRWGAALAAAGLAAATPWLGYGLAFPGDGPRRLGLRRRIDAGAVRPPPAVPPAGRVPRRRRRDGPRRAGAVAGRRAGPRPPGLRGAPPRPARPRRGAAPGAGLVRGGGGGGGRGGGAPGAQLARPIRRVGPAVPGRRIHEVDAARAPQGRSSADGSASSPGTR